MLWSFNPYFTGCSTSTSYCNETLLIAMLSFNPYFTGCSTSTKKPLKNRKIQRRFNPYFTGCSTSTGCCKRWKLGRRIVSILILLDVLLQLICIFHLWSVLHRFQSLFYWMFYFNLSILILILYYYFMFQSLFYWMFYFNLCIRCNSWKLYFVSILILLDVLLQPLNLFLKEVFIMKFQSLFYWMFYFNCCKIWKSFKQRKWFQSLFYWMFYFNIRNNLHYFIIM